MERNRLAKEDQGMSRMRRLLAEAGVTMSVANVMVTGGRVRAGYRMGELLFGKSDPDAFRGILHIIGERPGTVHHSYSVYITVLKGKAWAYKKVDHDVTKLVCNVANTALAPKDAAYETLKIIREMAGGSEAGTPGGKKSRKAFASSFPAF
jgi:ethanolamine ammonia-lyase large subunit